MPVSQAQWKMGTSLACIQNVCSLSFSHYKFKGLQLSLVHVGVEGAQQTTWIQHYAQHVPVISILYGPFWLFREFKPFVLAFLDIIPRWDTTLLPSLAALSNSNILVCCASQEALFLTKIFTFDMCNFQESKIWS